MQPQGKEKSHGHSHRFFFESATLFQTVGSGVIKSIIAPPVLCSILYSYAFMVHGGQNSFRCWKNDRQSPDAHFKNALMLIKKNTVEKWDTLSHPSGIEEWVSHWSSYDQIFILCALSGMHFPFIFRTALILCGAHSTRCWKHFSEISVHVDTIAPHSCCRFVLSAMCSTELRSGDCGVQWMYSMFKT